MGGKLLQSLHNALVFKSRRRWFSLVALDEVEASILNCDHTSGCIAKVDFLRVCIDTRAQNSVIGKQKSMAYSIYVRLEFKQTLRNWPAKSTFSNRRHMGLGPLNFWITFNETHVICCNLELVDVYVSILLGLDVLDEYKITLDT